MHELGVQAPTSPCSSLDEPWSQLLGHTQEEAVSLPRQPPGRVPHREADIKRFSSLDIVETGQGGIMRRMLRQFSGALLVMVGLGCGAGSAVGGSETATKGFAPGHRSSAPDDSGAWFSLAGARARVGRRSPVAPQGERAWLLRAHTPRRQPLQHPARRCSRVRREPRGPQDLASAFLRAQPLET